MALRSADSARADGFVVRALFGLLLLFSSTSSAHPFAVSEFEAKTDGRALGFSFRFDTTSVVDLVNRERPTAAPIGPEAVNQHRAIVERYVSGRFSVSNDGAPCKTEGFRRYELDPGKARVLVDLRFECGRELRTLEFRSTLFQDETTPHQIIGTMAHKNALERYFFTGGERVATIKLDELRQGGRPAVPSLNGVRIVPPPAGVKWGKPGPSAAVSVQAPCQGATCEQAPPRVDTAAPVDTARPWFLRSGTLLGVVAGTILLVGFVLARRSRLGRRAA